jgi:hypothetical protein
MGQLLIEEFLFKYFTAIPKIKPIIEIINTLNAYSFFITIPTTATIRKKIEHEKTTDPIIKTTDRIGLSEYFTVANKIAIKNIITVAIRSNIRSSR